MAKFKIDPVTKKFVSPNSPTPPAAAPKTTPADPPPTDAELEAKKKEVHEAAADIAAVTFGGKPPKREEPKPPAAEPKPGEGEVTPAAAAAPAAKVPVKKLPEKKAKEIPITRAEITRAATEAAEKVAERISAKPAADAPLAELEPEDQEDLEVFKEMEKNKKNEGLSQRFIDFRTKTEPAYQAKWLEEHPGQEFNPEDPEHDEFYAKNEPAYDKREFDKTARRLEIRAGVQEVLTPLQQETKRREAFQAAIPRITQQVDSQLHSFVKKVDPALAALLTDEKGNINLSAKAIDKMTEADPVASRVLKGIAIAPRDQRGQAIHPENYLGPLLTQIELLKARELGVSRDDKNPVDRRIAEYAADFDKYMAEAPDEVKYREEGGVVRQWVSAADYNAMCRAVEQSKDSQAVKQSKLEAIDNKYFAVDYDDIRLMILNEFSDKAKSEIETLNRTGAKKFGKPGAAAPQPTPQKPTPAQPVRQIKPTPPAPIGGANAMPSETPAPNGGEKVGEMIANKLFA